MAKEMQVENQQAEAALGVGVALRLEVRANVRGRAEGLKLFIERTIKGTGLACPAPYSQAS